MRRKKFNYKVYLQIEKVVTLTSIYLNSESVDYICKNTYFHLIFVIIFFFLSFATNESRHQLFAFNFKCIYYVVGFFVFLIFHLYLSHLIFSVSQIQKRFEKLS